MIRTIALALALGAVIGVLLGLLGGGSILAVPALLYVLGPPAEQAIPLSSTVIAIASTAGALPKAGQVHWRLTGVFAGATPARGLRVYLLQPWRRTRLRSTSGPRIIR